MKSGATNFTRLLAQADGPTSVTLTFSVRYASALKIISLSEYALTVTVTGIPAKGFLTESFGNGNLDPYPVSIPSLVYPTYSFSAQSQLAAASTAIILSAGPSSPVNATIKTAFVIGGPTLTGEATDPCGATLAMSVNGKAAVTVPSGSFNLPYT
jgi:hypothetical protein